MSQSEDLTIHHVIAALDYIKKVAEREQLEDVADLIDATFKICMTTYTITKRSELREQLLAYKPLSLVQNK